MGDAGLEEIERKRGKGWEEGARERGRNREGTGGWEKGKEGEGGWMGKGKKRQ
jgi:hypothetical protein